MRAVGRRMSWLDNFQPLGRTLLLEESKGVHLVRLTCSFALSLGLSTRK